MFERICLILLFNLCYFFKTLSYKYVSDDIPVFNRPKTWKNEWQKRWMQLEGSIRTNPQEDHFLTIIIHSLICVFIYTAFGANNISFLASFLFSVNPINNQGSVWISGRGYALSALGMTLAMTFPIIGPLLLLIATYSNAGFLAPICFIGSLFSWFCWFLPLIWGFHFFRFRKNVMQKIGTEMYAEDKKLRPEKIIVFIKTFSFYFIHALIPLKTSFYHSYMQSMAGAGKKKAYSFNDRFFWLGLIIFGFICWYWISFTWNIASFGLLWWTICIASFCNFFRMQQEISERYCYLASIGLMVALASFINLHPILYTFFLAMYATKMWFYMDNYMDDYYMSESSCLNCPDSWFAWHMRGMQRFNNKSFSEAIIIWTMARLISPLEYKINMNLASMLLLNGRVEEAKAFLKIAQDNIPEGQESEANKMIEDFKKGTITIIL